MSTEDYVAKVGNVLHPVSDVGAAVAFYRSALGVGLRFADGDRYAALDTAGATLALVGTAEDRTNGVVAASVKVADVDDAVRAFAAAGGVVVRQAEEGPHEVRAVVRDPWGNALVLYAPRGVPK
jgi:predicted enzyme related to lactoylglutathione lyase